MDLLDLLLDHDHWATARLLEASGGLSDAQLDQPFDIGHRTLRETFGHMIFNVPFWTAFLAGQPADNGGYSADAQPEDRSLAALSDHHERSSAAFASAARRLRAEGRLEETYVDHYAVRKAFGGTILMVVEHNEGHRTELLHILERLGVPDLPEVDLGVWEYRLLNT
ncbi:MAG: DinB family protein [Propionibacteriaceae bacterium]|nr:DinB family protein [Propionibacteriaceae bacterium]